MIIDRNEDVKTVDVDTDSRAENRTRRGVPVEEDSASPCSSTNT